ncbi:acyl-coenzyme A diphosphatase FITM2 [Engraulis encrasicolus]|uniref:acyl-coenzyme A diphosphatase FITM2 n=1 Tax=Engraulis encrasicolus TaxID=184585 RepID=UPI002FD320FE
MALHSVIPAPAFTQRAQVLQDQMANMDKIVQKLRKIWKISANNHILPAAFSLICILGSFLKEQDLVPDSYFSNTRNVLNLYFVKISWGWTLFLLVPFMVLSSKNSAGYLLPRLCALAVATAVWYVCVNTFEAIEEATGECYDASTKELRGELTSKGVCRRGGFVWNGFDISGHSFILSYSALVITEEMAASLDGVRGYKKTVLQGLYVTMSVIVYLWLFMFLSTSVYFHSLLDKVIGTSCGLMAWYLTYQVWYKMPLSPGLPNPNTKHKHHF